MEVKRSYIREGNHDPTTEELAQRVGIPVDKLEKLLFFSRVPLSMQQTVWADQDTTFQVDASSLLFMFHLASTCLCLKEKCPKVFEREMSEGKGHNRIISI